MKSILDRDFRYTPAVETDLKRTFARIRRKQREALNQESGLTGVNLLYSHPTMNLKGENK